MRQRLSVFALTTTLLAAGCLLYSAGLGAIISALYSFWHRFINWDTRALVALLGIASMYAGRQSVIYGRRLRVSVPVSLAYFDTRRPVLYLRSFSDDQAGEENWLIKYRFFPTRLPALIPPLQTEDEQLADVFRPIGPFVALSDPDITTSRLGPIPIPSGQDWQKLVLSLMEQASLIVIRLNTGKHLWWEIEQAMQNISRSRIVLLVNSQRHDSIVQTLLEAPRDDEYEFIRKKAQEKLAVSLPTIPCRDQSLGYSHLWGYVGFDKAGRSFVTDLTQTPDFRDGLHHLLGLRWWKPLVPTLR